MKLISKEPYQFEITYEERQFLVYGDFTPMRWSLSLNKDTLVFASKYSVKTLPDSDIKPARDSLKFKLTSILIIDPCENPRRKIFLVGILNLFDNS